MSIWKNIASGVSILYGSALIGYTCYSMFERGKYLPVSDQMTRDELGKGSPSFVRQHHRKQLDNILSSLFYKHDYLVVESITDGPIWYSIDDGKSIILNTRGLISFTCSAVEYSIRLDNSSLPTPTKEIGLMFVDHERDRLRDCMMAELFAAGFWFTYIKHFTLWFSYYFWVGLTVWPTAIMQVIQNMKKFLSNK